MKCNLPRTFALVLAVTFIFSTSACVSKEVDVAETSRGTEGTEAVDGTYDRANTPDSLPELDFGGETITILARTGESFWDRELDVEEDTGEIVDSAVYARNLSVENRLNCNIEVLYKDGNWDVAMSEFNPFIKQSILADDHAFDVIAGYGYLMCYLAMDNLLYNLSEVPYIDYSKPWWPPEISSELTMNGKMHLLTGDIALSTIKGMSAIFFNKQLAQTYQLEDFYSLVLSGKWTFDKYLEVCRSVSEDLNGNGEWDGGDLYSIANTNFDSFLDAFETPVTAWDSDGKPVLQVYSDKIVSIFQKLWDVHWNNTASYSPYNVWKGIDVPQFSENKVLLMNSSLFSAESLRSMEVDFGIIPYPKYDESQKDYHTLVSDNQTIMAFPINCGKVEMAGAVLEALAAESYRKVVPAYYEVALNEKYVRDSQSSQMLDIIHAGRTYNMGYTYTASIDINGSLYRQIFQQNENLTSFYETNKDRYEQNIQKIIDFYWN